VVCSFDARDVVGASPDWRLGELVGTQVLDQEILLLRVRLTNFVLNILRQLVLDSSPLDFGDLVMRVGAFDLVGPLHLICRDHQTA
jgi:hypothetical protein